MKNIYCSLLLTFAFNSQLATAEEFKKIYDKINHRVVEVCSTDADGTVKVATRCVYNWIDIPIISYAADPKLSRKPTELNEIVTPVHTMRNKDSVYAVFQNTLVEVNFGMANNTSEIIIYKPSEQSLHKYPVNSSWLVSNNDLALEVNEVPGFKKGDMFCLKQSPEGYPQGLQVKIKRLFNQDHYAVVDTVNEGFMGMGNTFTDHFTDLGNLVACSEKPNLDPAKAINTSSPKSVEDVKVFNQQAAKEVVAPAASTEQKSSGTSK